MSKLARGATPDQHQGQMLAHPIIEFWVELPSTSDRSTAVLQKVALQSAPTTQLDVHLLHPVRDVAESAIAANPQNQGMANASWTVMPKLRLLRYECDLLAQLDDRDLPVVLIF